MDSQEQKSQNLMSDENVRVIRNIISDYMQSSGFTNRKLTDTPLDGLQVVSRNYVNLNGTTAQRFKSPVTGQQYFDTTINRPIFYNSSIAGWIDAAGSIR